MLDGKYNFRENEKKWQDYWQEHNIYDYKPADSKKHIA